MKFGILLGLSFGLFVLLSGWIRLILLILSGGRFSNSVPWLYFFFGIYIGKGFSDNMDGEEYWTSFIISMLSALIVNQIAIRHEMRANGNYGTVSTSGSIALVGGLVGFLYRIIFL